MDWRYNPFKNGLLPDPRVKSSPAMTLLSPVAFLFLQWSQHKWIMILHLSPCKSIHGSSGNSLDSAGKMPAENLAKPWIYGMIYSLWMVFFQQWNKRTPRLFKYAVNAHQLPLTQSSTYLDGNKVLETQEMITCSSSQPCRASQSVFSSSISPILLLFFTLHALIMLFPAAVGDCAQQQVSEILPCTCKTNTENIKAFNSYDPPKEHEHNSTL